MGDNTSSRIIWFGLEVLCQSSIYLIKICPLPNLQNTLSICLVFVRDALRQPPSRKSYTEILLCVHIAFWCLEWHESMQKVSPSLRHIHIEHNTETLSSMAERWLLNRIWFSIMGANEHSKRRGWVLMGNLNPQKSIIIWIHINTTHGSVVVVWYRDSVKKGGSSDTKNVICLVKSIIHVLA